MAADPAVHGSQLATVPVFKGDSTDAAPIEEWLAQVERSKTQFNWTDTQTAAAVQTKLQGTAQSWLLAETLRNVTYTTWAGNNGLKTKLTEVFSPVVNEVQIANLLANLKQRDNESVLGFYSRLVKTVDKKNKDYDATQKAGAEYQNHFKKELYTFMAANLRPELRDRILNIPNPPTEIDELLKIATHLEKQVKPGATSVITTAATEEIKASPASTIDTNNQEKKKEAKEDLRKQVAALTTQVNALKKGGAAAFAAAGGGQA